MLQLNPPIPLITPKGPGLAHFLLDYGPEFDLFWTVFLDESRECWTFNNREIRACKNITLGRSDTFAKPARMAPAPTPTAPAALSELGAVLKNGTRCKFDIGTQSHE